MFKGIRYLIARAQKKTKLSAVRGSVIHPTSVVESGCQIVDVRFDRHSFCGHDCIILNADIGSFCSIADLVYIGGAAHPLHFVSTSPVFLSHRDSVKRKFSYHEFQHLPKTKIGNDVWIGFGARIRAGITIGHGAVVGMGAIVTHDVEPFTIVAGNPAKIISRRFTPEVSQELLNSKWWDFPDEELEKMAVSFNNPVEFLKDRGLL
jgi:acetyltransferase-like isoleucine patch superfamily enzyme